jgi:hypothetical protein
MTEFFLNGQLLADPPVEWLDLEYLVNFSNNANQPTITLDTFTFVGDAKEIIDAHIATHIFEGIDFRIEEDGEVFFDGMLDFVKEFKEDDQIKNLCGVLQRDDIDHIDNRFKGITFRYIEEKLGTLDYTDVPIIVIEKFQADQLALVSIMIFTISKLVQDIGLQIGKAAAAKASLVIQPPLSKPAGLLEVIIELVIRAIYIAALVAALLNLINQVAKYLFPPRGNYKGITLHTAMTAISRMVGLNFSSTIPEMKSFVYLPSKQGLNVRQSKRESGIPDVTDFGYTASEFTELVTDLFFARTKVMNGTLHIESLKNNDFWRSGSGYTMHSLYEPLETPNTSELSGTSIVSYTTDNIDDWTVDDSVGFAVEVTTSQSSYKKDENNLIGGYDRIDLPVALGSVKDSWSELEDALQSFARGLQKARNILGISKNIPDFDIGRNRIKISKPYFGVPKLIEFKNGKPSAKDKIKAISLWRNYHSERSFVYNAQEKIQTEMKIKFTLNDFKTLLRNNRFETADGRRGYFTSLRWRRGSEYALADYRIKDVYCKGLSEDVKEV